MEDKNLQEVIYSGNGGIGLIANGIKEIDFINAVKMEVGNEVLEPNKFTTLNNFFSSPIMYCGLQKNKNCKILIFYAGENSDLFQEIKY